MKCPFQKSEGLPLKNLVTGEILYDTLHHSAKATNILCNEEYCSGSSMGLFGTADRVKAVEEQKQASLFTEAQKFLTECYREWGRDENELNQRLSAVKTEIDETGSYDLTSAEMELGGKLAWRNSPRCPGRIQWKNLKFFDCRQTSSLEEVFEAICRHIEFSTNDGNIKPAITVFPKRTFGEPDVVRIWNLQLITYAGYLQEDGTVIGDKVNTEITQLCLSLGWKPKYTYFDVLPIILSGPDGEPHFFEIPEKLIKRVKIEHPRYPQFEKLGLEWFALPAVSSMMFEIGGLEFPAAPFSGWYSLPEVAVRDILDKQRYNMAKPIAKILNLDTASVTNFWMDRVTTEVSVAVLHSYNKHQVTIVDHFKQADQFMDFFQSEHEIRGGCPADWVWIVPPLSGSQTPVFHQEMLNYQLCPAFHYQKSLPSMYRPKGQELPSFKATAKALVFMNNLFAKRLRERKTISIYYATETGASKAFSATLQKIFVNGYVSKAMNIAFVNTDEILNPDSQEVQQAIFIVSTFGNGDPPTGAVKFAAKIKDLMNRGRRLENLEYGVFALGSSAYPNYCAFGKFLDDSFHKLGAVRILPIGMGDELNGQEDSFEEWMFGLSHLNDVPQGVKSHLKRLEQISNQQLFEQEFKWEVSKQYIQEADNMQHVHGKTVRPVKILNKQIVANRFIHLELDVSELNGDIRAGDHIAIYPRNDTNAVTEIVSSLQDLPAKETPVTLTGGTFAAPTGTLEFLLHAFYDINGLLSARDMKFMERFMLSNEDVEKLHVHQKSKTKSPLRFVDLFKTFPSLAIRSEDFVGRMKLTRPRLYSIASSPKVNSEGQKVLDLIISTVEYIDAKGIPRKGVCTSFLKNCNVDSIILGHYQASTLFGPVLEDQSRPLIMIANGSGIAPFRGIWQARLIRDQNENPVQRNTKDLLFFGCRSPKEDLYATETEGILERYSVYSRDPDQPKKYVQDMVKARKYKILDYILNMNAIVLVCGSAGMADGVKNVMDAFLEWEGLSVEDMKMTKSYIEEIFV
uniref:nitric-oxide synthase (NADPH) n=2 Tax=Tigriopus japonicus TaxID=158387 RepID=A0A0S3CQH0_TIGJA|nr:inducible nitric oxide synthase [Tigriopus japonicus]